MKTRYDAIVAGHLCLDVFPKFLLKGTPNLSEVFVPGRLINMDRVTFSTGGAVSNTGLVLHKLGLNVQLMGKLGDDLFGQGIRSVLDQYGVADSMTVVPDEHSSYTIVLVPGSHDRIFLHFPGANDTFAADDINYDIVTQSRLFHFGYPPLMKKLYLNTGAELIDMYYRAKTTGVTTSLDMSFPDPNSEAGKVDWASLLNNLLPHVDIFLPSAEEAMFMLNRPCFDQLCKQTSGDILDRYTEDDITYLADELLNRGAKIVAIKVGHRGLLLRTSGRSQLEQLGRAKPSDLANWSNRHLWEETFHVDQVVSATGAGDSTIAGLLAGILNDKTVEQTLKIACAVGGQNVQAVDALSGISDWKSTLAMIDNWPKRRQSLNTPWRYDDNLRVWIGPDDGKS